MQQTNPVKIEGIGRYLPKRVVSSEELETRLELSKGWIAKRNGVLARHWVEPQKESNAFMGARAAEEALEAAGLTLSNIDLILNASGTYQQPIPENSPFIQQELGPEAHGIACMSIGVTCLSFVVALDSAAQFLATGRYKKILIVSSEIASVGLNFEEAESSTLLGDGAAAIVLGRTPEHEASAIHTAHLETFSDGAHLTEIKAGGSYHPPYNYQDSKDTDFLFAMQGLQTLKLSKTYAYSFLENLSQGLSIGLSTQFGDIDWVIPHQSSKVGLKMMESFGWPADKFIRTIEKLGNCIAASIPLTLYEGVESGRLERGQKVLLIGTSAGISMGGVILSY